MKNFMNKVTTKVQSIKDKAKGLIAQGYWKLQQKKMRTSTVLSTQSGEGFVDTARASVRA